MPPEHGSDMARSRTIVRPAQRNAAPILSVEHLDFWYDDTQALFDVNLEIYPNEVVAFMGPSGCGKSTLLKCFNRMQDAIQGTRMSGAIRLEGQDINAPEIDPPMLRRRYGWVAQQPNPFPRSVFENVAYPARIHDILEPGESLEGHVRDCLSRAGLWEEVKDRLDERGTNLSGGQQQRLCIARALSLKPTVMLMDEPCSAIDPIATEKIEALIAQLRQELAIVIITHNLQQAARVSDRAAFFKMGYLLEVGPTREVFESPLHPETRAYIAGKFG